MPRPVAFMGIAVLTLQILNDRLHKVDEKTLDEKRNVKKHTWFRDDQCYQYYMTLEIHIGPPGQVHTVNE